LAIPVPPRINVSPEGQPFIWDDELRSMVRSRYAEDFDRFGYDPGAA